MARRMRPELLLSQLLALHLDLALKRYKGPPAMSKFDELAAFTEETLKDWDDQAHELLVEGQKLKARGNEVFGKHRAKQSEARAGFAKMENAVRALEGANLPNDSKEGEATGSDSSSSSFPPRDGNIAAKVGGTNG